MSGSAREIAQSLADAIAAVEAATGEKVWGINMSEAMRDILFGDSAVGEDMP